MTAVLGNAQGGLELLPGRAYGNEWLFVVCKGRELLKLPVNGDPYKEIYKLRTQWFRLLNEVWLNPANLKTKGFEFTCALLTSASKFHDDIAGIYHPNSYAHYGVDPKHPAWHRVVWEIGAELEMRADVSSWRVSFDSRQGALRVFDPGRPKPPGMPVPWVGVCMRPAADPGDQTVPAHSANH